MWYLGIGLLVVVAAIGLWFVTTYNKLVKTRNQVDEAWSDIDVQLKRRFDLIPNIIETVKGYASHEKEVFTKVTEARASAMKAEESGDPKAVGQAENMLTGALKTLFAVAENYPELKANTNFLQLQDELSDTENKIQASRRFYNGVVRDFNTKIQVFPTNLIAGMLGFKAREFFEVDDEAEREAPKVKF
ncbi:MAG: LemA family protein [Candidatus Kerfeldbacteria bacterium]